MSTKLPTCGSDPMAANRARHLVRNTTRTARTAFTIYNDRGRIPRKRKKYMYLTERANYSALLISVIEWKMREATK